MAAALCPARFYGSDLPRPRVFPGDRVDPPALVTDALLSWAREAHWSMGGLGAKRLRLQGRIEGNLVKIRRTVRRDAKARAAGQKPASLDALGSDDDELDQEDVDAQERALRREVVDEEEDFESGESGEDGEVALVTIAAAAKRKRMRKLADELDCIEAQQVGGKKKPAAGTPAKKALAAASAPAAEAPAKSSLKKVAAAVAGATARTPSKRKSAEAPVARRTSPRTKH